MADAGFTPRRINALAQAFEAFDITKDRMLDHDEVAGLCCPPALPCLALVLVLVLVVVVVVVVVLVLVVVVVVLVLVVVVVVLVLVVVVVVLVLVLVPSGILHEMGMTASDQDVQEVLKQLDKNKDERIVKGEFMQASPHTLMRLGVCVRSPATAEEGRYLVARKVLEWLYTRGGANTQNPKSRPTSSPVQGGEGAAQ